MRKRISSDFYTRGKYGKGYRETECEGSKYLFSLGRYPTKITEEDLPEHYIPIHCRTISYMRGFLKTSGIVDMEYTYCKENHLFKDDYIYISYSEKLEWKPDSFGFLKCTNYDVCIDGSDIINIVLAAEKYSGFDTSEVRRKIEEKRVWLRDNEPQYYKGTVGEDCDLFDFYIRKGYVNPKVL